MGLCRTLGPKAPLIAPLLLALLVVGCSGMKPYEPRDHREEGPEQGLFTGSQGEWVIFRREENTGEQKPESQRE